MNGSNKHITSLSNRSTTRIGLPEIIQFWKLLIKRIRHK